MEEKLNLIELMRALEHITQELLESSDIIRMRLASTTPIGAPEAMPHVPENASYLERFGGAIDRLTVINRELMNSANLLEEFIG